MQEQATSSLPSSSERSSSSAAHQGKEGAESDDEIRRVPDFGGELPPGASTSGREVSSAGVGDRIQVASAEAGQQRKRGRDPADKEHKRLKRLLRNRVSAQQARERKKAYLNDLEVKVKELEKRNSELEERLSTLQNENQMLRQDVCAMASHYMLLLPKGRKGGRLNCSFIMLSVWEENHQDHPLLFFILDILPLLELFHEFFHDRSPMLSTNGNETWVEAIWVRLSIKANLFNICPPGDEFERSLDITGKLGDG